MATKKYPEVSVVMAVHNGARYVHSAVDSVLNQTLSNFEFIIVDDSSTDETKTILDKFDDQRLIRLQNSKNIGLTKSLNKGLIVTRGSYIARMDADDICLPNRLEKQVQFLENHPEVGVLGTAVQVIDQYGKHRNLVLPPAQEHNSLQWFQCFASPFAHPTVMMRRAAVLNIGSYDESFTTAQDRDLWQRLSKVTQLANLSDALLQLRVHTNNISVIHQLEQKRNSAKVMQRIFQEYTGKTIAFEDCMNLELGKFKRAEEAYTASQMVRSLYRVFIKNTQLTSRQYCVVRDDYARRLYQFALPWMSNFRLRLVMLEACTINPKLTLNNFRRRLTSIFKLNLRPKLSE